MSFQVGGEVRVTQAQALPGEIQPHGPFRTAPYRLASVSPANNVFGRAFWHSATTPGEVQAENTVETLAFAGILAIPKEHALIGVGGAASALDPTFTLPNDTEAEFLTFGFIVAKIRLATAAIRDPIFAVETTGAITPVDDASTVPIPNCIIAPILEAATAAIGDAGILQLTN